MPAETQVRVAIIGAGYMASEHLRAFSACPDVLLTGIHSRSSDRAQKIAQQYPGLKVTSSIDELWEKSKADLVVIAVPILACKEVCDEAFRHNWTLLIEKPVGHNLEEAKEIEKLAEQHKAKAYVALNRRFFGSTIRLQKELNCIHGKRVVTILDQEDTNAAIAAGQPLQTVHNWMYANSIHLIDYFTQLCRGNHAKTHILHPWNSADPGPVIAHLYFDSGDLGLYQAAWNAPGPWSVAVSTTLLRAELRPIEQLSLQQSGTRRSTTQSLDPLDQQFKPGLLRQAQEAVKAARGKANTLPTIKEANRSMSIVSSIYGLA
ncbi:Gfo/Idh/MocA family protein [Synechococcus sp. MU1650]|uniref:Gfo/Idh/MocA family protein n=1 Tax=Synechococcus sp. MU1650 TaxID=2508352 RepID=UPI001CF83A6A|nr:Gfo/Idh/MocA family oxidoreductase [Synechococcus sp. MU1650]MCB4378465.1 Gfo/Idh/MocA family oxidoreductase [Synechococcus sp. MU1650]